MYVRVRPRTLEESNEELGVEHDKLEVSNSINKVVCMYVKWKLIA